jgi:8-oxo-dGTP pyrophosphatase MutT (NUDIX family)
MKIYRAGILPYYIEDNTIKYYLMKPSSPVYGGDRFQIAKGRIEKYENPKQAALREGFEELGLLEENIIKLDFLGEFLGRTYIYIAKIRNPQKFSNFTFETGETKWLSYSEFKEIGRGIHIPVLEVAENIIKAQTRTRNNYL